MNTATTTTAAPSITIEKWDHHEGETEYTVEVNGLVIGWMSRARPVASWSSRYTGGAYRDSSAPMRYAFIAEDGYADLEIAIPDGSDLRKAKKIARDAILAFLAA